MWAIRFLSGPLAGKSIALKEGSQTLGRSPTCEIQVPSGNISKEHLKIDVLFDKVILTDLGSRNGTFVQGVKVKSHNYKPGEKIAINEVFMEIVQPKPKKVAPPTRPQAPTQRPAPQMNSYDQGNLAYQQQQQYQPYTPGPTPSHMRAPPDMSGSSQQIEKDLFKHFSNTAGQYLENVMLPGIYKLGEVMELKWAMGLFMLSFILAVTFLSSIPLVRLLKSSIEQESQRRAKTIVQTLARTNVEAIAQGQTSVLTVEFAQKEPGVDKAYIVNANDGSIMAPANEAGQYPSIPFVHSARKIERLVVEQIKSDQIGASHPIFVINPETGNSTVAAYAIIIYDMGSLAIDDNRTLSLIIQTLLIALIVGGLVFFFMYKLVEYPVVTLNRNIDQALKSGSSVLDFPYDFPAFQKLISNVSSIIGRAQTVPTEGFSGNRDADRGPEIQNLIQLIGFPALAINYSSLTIYGVNNAMEAKLGIDQLQMLNANLEVITDQALKKSMTDLLQRVGPAPTELHTNNLEISGTEHMIAAMAMMQGEQVGYVIITIIPQGGG